MSSKIKNIINKCKYNNRLTSDSDVKINDELLQSLSYISNSDELCMELQALYNIHSDNESYGSSLKYLKNIEPFGKQNALKSHNISTNFKVFIIFLIIFCVGYHYKNKKN